VHLDERQHRPQPLRPRSDRGPRRRSRGRSQRHFQAAHADRDLSVRRSPGGHRRGLFASLQTYITPDAFTFDLSVLFFIAILIGGRGSILGPMLGPSS